MILFSSSDLYEYPFKALIKMRPRSTEFNEDKSMYLVCVSSFKICVKVSVSFDKELSSKIDDIKCFGTESSIKALEVLSDESIAYCKHDFNTDKVSATSLSD